MSKIVFKENQNKTKPSFRDSNINGYYCFDKFKGIEYFEICTSSKDENNTESHHYRQVIDLDKETAIQLINLLKDKFKLW